jgi:hypothetical protein
MTQQLLAFHNRQHPFRPMFPELSHVAPDPGVNVSPRYKSLVLTCKNEFHAFFPQPED